MRARFLDVRDGASLRSRADTDFHAAHERLYEHVFVVRIDMMLTDLDLECLLASDAPAMRGIIPKYYGCVVLKEDEKEAPTPWRQRTHNKERREG